jgi:hypothetical protein
MDGNFVLTGEVSEHEPLVTNVVALKLHCTSTLASEGWPGLATASPCVAESQNSTSESSHASNTPLLASKVHIRIGRVFHLRTRVTL